MLEATCHCGAVRITVRGAPEFVVDCNCSICRRNGALWAFYEPEAVVLIGHPENTTQYVWGQRSIRTMHCNTCGCVTHWEPVEGSAGNRLGVNARNFDPSLVQGVKVRKFDGADTWTYVE